ncbi:MAG TPA: hypothetical protein VJ249_10345 [Candidatus Bathyarchaeia archaeon]|nr:hypothetical protein [Candidatus Bathyarchaeia archaeon]
MSLEKIRKMMEKHGVPGRDLYSLPTSEKRFPDKCHYRIEISGIERPSTLEAVIDEMEKRKVPVHRLISTVMGATLLSDKEMEQFAKLAHDAKLEIIITPGPRTLWDLGGQVRTPEGALSGIRFRGSDNLAYVIADIRRAIDFGFRGFLVVDEGLLWLLAQMRKAGDIPKDVVFKVSIFAGHANPAGAKVLETLGANTFNPVADVTLPMLAAIRKAVNIPIDVHVYLFDSFGGFNRLWETPEIARVTAPCYFKIEPGPSVSAMYKPWVSPESLAFSAREKVKNAETIIQLVDKNYPEAKPSKIGAKDLAIPKP